MFLNVDNKAHKLAKTPTHCPMFRKRYPSHTHAASAVQVPANLQEARRRAAKAPGPDGAAAAMTQGRPGVAVFQQHYLQNRGSLMWPTGCPVTMREMTR